MELDHFTIARVEPGQIWLELWEEDGRPHPRGPIPAPNPATRLLQKAGT